MVKILKFGGSSVATPERIKQVAKIVGERVKTEQIILVVSALRGTTDQLIECARLAAAGDKKYKKICRFIGVHHRNLLKKLIKKNNHYQAVYEAVEKLLSQLAVILNSIESLRDTCLNSIDIVASYGEQLSATIIAAYLNTRFRAGYADARQFIVTNESFTQAKVLYDESRTAIRRYFKHFVKQRGKHAVAVVTGFIGMTKNKQTTTLGRDGSNYTAATLGAALDAKGIELWSDVDGVFSADPNLIKESITLPHLSYNEAIMLAYFEDKVLRSAIIPQLVANNIPVFVKNTMNPESAGTKISKRSKKPIVKNISVMNKLVLITLSPMQIKIPHLIERLYHALTLADIDFRLITQPSPINDVCFSIQERYFDSTMRALEAEFLYEFHEKLLKTILTRNQSVIAVIGDNIKKALSTLGKVFIALDNHGVQVNGIAYGTAECNMSFIIHSYQGKQALEVIHHTVFTQILSKKNNGSS